MGKFDKYVLSQLMALFGFFSLVLVLVYWVNRAVVLFDQLIANGHSAMVFVEFTALTLPNVIRLVMPVSAFAAVVYGINRLSSDSELVVVQATGFSPFRMARPVLMFGVIVGLMVSVLTHVLVPASLNELADRRAQLEQNFTARFLREGTFLHPAKGITFYIREIEPNGELQNVFLADDRSADTRTSYTGKKAVFAATPEGPKLIMFDGMAQSLDRETNKLSTIQFEDFVYDVGALLSRTEDGRLDADALSTRELMFPTKKIRNNTYETLAELQAAGNERISQALLCVVSALLGFSALLLGGFSRFGLWKQICAAVVSLILLKLLDNFMVNQASSAPGRWPLVYMSSLIGLACACLMLWVAGQRSLFRRRHKGQPA
ncbi:MAG: LPS export ABC transporter permease LptF [Marinosulfonomonas sp.]